MNLEGSDILGKSEKWPEILCLQESVGCDRHNIRIKTLTGGDLEALHCRTEGPLHTSKVVMDFFGGGIEANADSEKSVSLQVAGSNSIQVGACGSQY